MSKSQAKRRASLGIPKIVMTEKELTLRSRFRRDGSAQRYTCPSCHYIDALVCIKVRATCEIESLCLEGCSQAQIASATRRALACGLPTNYGRPRPCDAEQAATADAYVADHLAKREAGKAAAAGAFARRRESFARMLSAMPPAGSDERH